MSENYLPTRGNYNDLKPFKFWCQKVLPLVYDDSLSYYELLDKVVDYLNKTMEDVTTLNDDVTAMYGAYEQLQGYVNSYFDNLDVQAEINSKLDQMAIDGSLSALIDPRIPGAVSAWLRDNVDPVGSAVVVDSTLTISGAAADAKVTGDNFNDLKAELTDLNKITVYNDTSFRSTLFALAAGYRINALGRYALDNNWVGAQSGTVGPAPYVYAGTKITANEGYTFSYSLWDIPLTSSTDVSHRLALELNVESGRTITIEKNGYLGFSCAYATPSTLPTDKTAYEFANDAVTIELYFRPIKEQVVTNTNDITYLKGQIQRYISPDDITYVLGNISAAGVLTSYRNAVRTSSIKCKQGDIVSVDNGYIFKVFFYSSSIPDASTYIKRINWTTDPITVDTDGFMVICISDLNSYNVNSVVLPDTSYSEHLHIGILTGTFDAIDNLENTLEQERTFAELTNLYKAQKAVAEDWHFPFIDVYNALGLGNNHLIPNTKNIWSQSGTVDLSQKDTWMRDGTHPYYGVGIVDMYGRTIASQLKMYTPAYHEIVGPVDPTYWSGKRLLWLGTSIPAGSDPYAGEGTGATYPSLVASLLGATVTNLARGSSCLRINASTGEYTNFHFNHFLRAITRTIAECDEIASNWSSIYSKISGAPSTLTEEQVQIMKSSSFENFFLPYLNGTHDMPDCFVIDYGHNDVRPRGVNGKSDLWVQPNTENINSGILADDNYMTRNNYTNLKLALNSDLSGIPNLNEFSASLNRCCLQGAFNFLITVILSYNPYARIVIVSDYN